MPEVIKQRRAGLGLLQTARNGTGGQSRLPAELALAFADKLFTGVTQPFSALAPCIVHAFYVVAYGATLTHMVDLSGFLRVVRIYFRHDTPPFKETQALELALPTPQVWHEARPWPSSNMGRLPLRPDSMLVGSEKNVNSGNRNMDSLRQSILDALDDPEMVKNISFLELELFRHALCYMDDETFKRGIALAVQSILEEDRAKKRGELH